MLNIAKIIIFTGIFLILAALLIIIVSKLGIHFAKFPKDLVYKGKTFVFHFPIITSIIISIVLTIILNLIFWIARK